MSAQQISAESYRKWVEEGGDHEEGWQAGVTQKTPSTLKAVPEIRFPLPDRVEERIPLYFTYGQWTGDIAADELIPPRGAPEGSYFDEAKAQHAVDKIQSLYHFEGRFAGNRIRLSWWELRIVRYIFGWMRPDGTRIIRTLYLEIPRKNGKTTFAALLAIYLAYWDNEPAASVFFGAMDREQASYCYDKALIFTQMDEELNEKTISYVGAKKIVIPETNSQMKALVGKPQKLYGLNLHGLVYDEVAQAKTREMYDALTTSSGSRIQPLTIIITTAGFNRNQNIAYEQREYTRQVHEGKIVDPSFLGVVYALPEDADWGLEVNWYACCPGLGEVIDIEYYREHYKKAAAPGSTYGNTFRILFCCQWVGQAHRIINMKDWDKCDELVVSQEQLKEVEAYGGLDLSSTTSLTAFVLCFPNVPEDGYYTLLARHWLPEEGIVERGRDDHVNYQFLAENPEVLQLVPGPVILDDYIHDTIRELAETYNFRTISFDRWGAISLSRSLEDDGFDMVKVSQGMVAASPPTKELLRLIASHKLVTMNNPIMAWQADNVAPRMDAAGNIMFDRKSSASRIDGLVASWMALDGALRYGTEYVSVYATGGVDAIYDDEKWQKREDAISETG